MPTLWYFDFIVIHLSNSVSDIDKGKVKFKNSERRAFETIKLPNRIYEYYLIERSIDFIVTDLLMSPNIFGGRIYFDI